LPATCQKMFFACAPPISVTFFAAASARSLLVWKTQTSFAPPEMVRSVAMLTALFHCTGQERGQAPSAPLPSSRWSGVGRPAASV